MSSPFIVGITGGSGSGKSTFTKALAKNLGRDVEILTQDNYYFPIDQQPRDALGKPNFDLPESLNLEKFHQDVLALSKGETIYQKEYTFNNPVLVPKPITIKPATLILIEGLFIFYLPQTEALFDLKIFLDTHEDLKLQRRLLRDTVERGYTDEDIQYVHEHHVEPAFIRYIQHYLYKADIVIPNHDNFKKGLEMVECYLKTKLA